MKLLGINGILDDLKGWSKGDYIWGASAIGAMTALSLYWKDSPIGIISALSNIMCVLLVAKGKLSNYFWGLIGVVLYGYIAFANQYFGDAMLNFGYYLPMQFVGAYMWTKRDGSNDKFRELNIYQKLNVGVLATLAIICYGHILTKLGGALPFVDATSTVLSVVAMILMASGFLDQWYLWILVNCVSIMMWVKVFVEGGENISTLIMWIVFLINSVYGLINWRKLVQRKSS